MKKTLAIVLAVVILLLISGNASSLVAERTEPLKQKPISLTNLTVARPLMTTWSVSTLGIGMSDVRYAAGDYISFMAEITVEGIEDVGDYAWGLPQMSEAELVITSPGGGVDFTWTTMAFLVETDGISATSWPIRTNMNVSHDRIVFNFDAYSGDLGGLYIAPATEHTKVYYLHFTARANTSTQGICRGEMIVGTGVESDLEYGRFYPLYRDNEAVYQLAKLSNRDGGPWDGVGDIYAVYDVNEYENVIAFVVSGGVRGLAGYKADIPWYTVIEMATPTSATPTTATPTSTLAAFDAVNYEDVWLNRHSDNEVSVVFKDGWTEVMELSELREIVEYLGWDMVWDDALLEWGLVVRGSMVSEREAVFNRGVFG